MIIIKNEKLKFETFKEFIDKAEDIRQIFDKLSKNQKSLYCDYIYQHNFHENSQKDELIKGKCWEWCLSLEYEPMIKNDLCCILGYCNKN